MNDIFCIDETFDNNSSSSYHLSIQAGFDAITYTVLNTVINKYILLKSINLPNFAEEVLFEQIEKIFNEEEFLSLKYKSVIATFKTRKYTFIPEEYFSTEHLKILFESCFKLNDLDELHNHKLDNLNVNCVFALPNQVANIIAKKFSNVKFLFHSLPLVLEAIEITKTHTYGNYFFININAKWFELFYLKEGKIKFQNSFSYVTAQDLLYFMIYTAKQLDIPYDSITVICSGDIEKNSSLNNILTKYFESVRFYNPKKGYIYSYTFNKLQLHKFSNLINLMACE